MTKEQELIIKKAGFLLYLDQRPNIEMLEDDEAGILLKTIYAYANGLEIDESFNGNRALQQVFLTIKHSLIRDSRKYEERCKKASENALARWEKTKEENTNLCNRIQTNANYNDIDRNKENEMNRKIKKERKIESEYSDFDTSSLTNEEYAMLVKGQLDFKRKGDEF